MAPNEDWEKYSKKVDDKPEGKIVALDDQDIQILKTYGQGPYSLALKKIDQELKDIQKRIDEKLGVKESDTGLAPPNLWDLQADKQRMGEHTLNVARCSTIIKAGETKAGGVPQPAATNPQDGGGGGNPEGDKYVINIRQHAKYVVGLDENVAPTDVEGESSLHHPFLSVSNSCLAPLAVEGMRVGVDRTNYKIKMPLPPKIDPSVTMMQVEEKPDVTYDDIGGCKEQIDKLREVVEMPLLNVSCASSDCNSSDTDSDPVAGTFRRARYRSAQGCHAIR